MTCSGGNTEDPRITREQSRGIPDVVNDRGFAMHYRATSNLEVFQCERINTAKQKKWIEFSSYDECFRSKDFSI